MADKIITCSNIGVPQRRARWSVLAAFLLTFLSGCQSVELASKAGAKSSATKGVNQAAILRYDTVHHPLIAQKGMVVTQNEIASRVGQKILQQGGNAIDAAVAVGFALAVTLPRAGNIGGSGFILAHIAKTNETIALDFRSAAPAMAKLSDFVGDDGEIDWEEMSFGPKAPGVPGTVAGLYEAWERFGTMPWAELLAPAIDLARDGIIVSDDLFFALKEFSATMSHYPSSEQVYKKADGQIYAKGDLWQQPDLAWSLRQIANGGADAFYQGEIATRIDNFMRSNGGYLSAKDLKSYRVNERAAISTVYKDHSVIAMPPVSGGGIAVLQLLNVMSQFQLDGIAAGSAQYLHYLAEAMKRVAANRRVGIGDPNFVDVPVEAMISDRVAAKIASEIDAKEARPVKDIAPMDVSPYESADTTHFSIADRHGNGVAVTYTLGYSFGSGLIIPGTGILLDNQLRNFSHRIVDHANVMQAGKRMVSTMTPIIVLDAQEKLFLVTGTPGGGRIPNIIAQVLLNVLEHDMNIAEATHAPRIHQQWRTPQFGYEKGHSNDSIKLLEAMGHATEVQQTMGSTQSILLKNGYFYGASDPRRPGALAVGVDSIDR